MGLIAGTRGIKNFPPNLSFLKKNYWIRKLKIAGTADEPRFLSSRASWCCDMLQEGGYEM